MKSIPLALLVLAAGALVAPFGHATAATCRVDGFTGGAYNPDPNQNFGEWGTIFLAVDTAPDKNCLLAARDHLSSKVKDQNLDENRWRYETSNGVTFGLKGGDLFLLTAAALRLGAQGLLTSDIHQEIQDALGAYEVVHHSGPCDRTSGNGCMDDYTIAAAAYGWGAAYLRFTQATATTPSGAVRDFGWFYERAKQYLELSLSPEKTLCIRPLSSVMCTGCSDQYNFGYATDEITSMETLSLANNIAGDQVEVLSFEHTFENPNYGIGLLTSVATAIQGLEVAGGPWEPSDFQKVIAHGLFRTGQRHATETTNVCQVAWLDNCVGLGCSRADETCIVQGCFPPANGCADFGYRPGMYPVKPLLDNEFELASTMPTLVLAPNHYQFDRFEFEGGPENPLCANSPFQTTPGFFNDGRYAAYYQIPYLWAYVEQPRVWGVSPAQYVDQPSPGQVVRSGATTFSGWGFDGEGALSASSFSFTLDGQPIALQSFTYGAWRGDVCDHFDLMNPVTCWVGWSGSFTPPWWLATGYHTLTVTVTVQHTTGPSTSTFRRQFYYQP